MDDNHSRRSDRDEGSRPVPVTLAMAVVVIAMGAAMLLLLFFLPSVIGTVVDGPRSPRALTGVC